MAAIQPTMEYAVHLEVFEGPLDLLLRLIEKAELDITTISLARVTDQYLAYIRQLDEIHPDLLADFLVVAARLILIKSRALLPRPPVVAEDEEEDVGEDLVRQLEEYKRFKQAAQHLQSREEQGLRCYVRVAPPLIKPRGLIPGEVSLDDLVAALERVLNTKPHVPVSTVVSPISINIDDKIRAIESAVATGRRVHFTGLLISAGSRIEIVVTFLAILELIKQAKVVAQQEAAFGEIYLIQPPPLPDPIDDRDNGSQPA